MWWSGRVEQSVAHLDSEHAELYLACWRELSVRLLNLGGDDVVPPPAQQPLLAQLLVEGRAMSAARAVSSPGRRSDCHANCLAALSGPSGGDLSMATGFALSDDGLWRQHSWLISASGAVVETTRPRSAYFGITLSADQVAAMTGSQL